MKYTRDEFLDVQGLILNITSKFIRRKSLEEPLTKTLGDYSNNLMLRAIKNIMFENRLVPVDGKLKRIWILRQYPEINVCAKIYPEIPGRSQDHLSFLVNKVIEEKRKLRSFVWSKNGWGIPPENKVEKDLVLVTKDVDGEGNVFLLSGSNFISANIEKFKRYIYNVGPAGHRKKAEKTLKIIYKAIYDAKVLGEDLASKEKNEIIRNLNVHLSVHCVENENLKKEIIDLKKKLENIKRLI